jgi:AbrB family looped-hinge helix DNA binding protein
LSTRGQLVLPKALRDRRGWRAGDTFVVEDRPDGVLIREAADDAPSRVEDVFGCLGPAKQRVSIEDMNSAPGDYVRRRWGREYDDSD